ncbi:hypothetical protein HUZ31_03990 [Brucella suis bv. 5]|nr:hypothetical protein HUZ31_03990 [Brucella suis bv. 5]
MAGASFCAFSSVRRGAGTGTGTGVVGFDLTSIFGCGAGFSACFAKSRLLERFWTVRFLYFLAFCASCFNIRSMNVCAFVLPCLKRPGAREKNQCQTDHDEYS